MEERSAHFFTLVAQVCESAQLAKLPVSLVLEDGSRFDGHPLPASPDGRELDDTGYADSIRFDDRSIPLSDVVEVVVRRPPQGASS